MLRKTMILLWLALAIGCAKETPPVIAPSSDPLVPYNEYLSNNRTNISRLQLGMTRSQVMDVMKSYTSKVGSGPLSNPFRSSKFMRNQDTYEVMFFLTEPHRMFIPIRESQATPVVLKNGVVVGVGQSALAGVVGSP
jgi:hypothetical protein